ncbi:MAG: hypothetical protein HQ548_06660, partial [Chloroflexi bacterium]|nr:hypothetical protein [Chloroflexota bacterium]
MVMQGAIYVAEVVVPEAAYAAPTVREQLPAPEYFGVERGYWRVHFDEDHLGVSYPTGILLTLQTAAKDREEAEDKAIASSKKIGEFVDFYTGSPRHPPCLRRLARVSATGGLLEQHDYSYWWPEHPEWFGMAEIKVNQLQMLLGRFGRLGDRPRRNLELAVRWYGISVSSADTLDAYLGAWIGLESIGPLLDGLFHTSGPRAACPTCQN